MDISRRLLTTSAGVAVLLIAIAITSGCGTTDCNDTATCPIVGDDAIVTNDSGIGAAGNDEVGLIDTGGGTIDATVDSDDAPVQSGMADTNDRPSSLEGAPPVDGALTEAEPPTDSPPPPTDGPLPIDGGGGPCPTNATLPYPVDGNGGAQAPFIPSGYVADWCAITMTGTAGACAGHTISGSVGKCWLVTLKRPAPCSAGVPLQGSAGVIWQYPMNNWTDPSTMGGINMCGATSVTFWAAGAIGTEVVTFFAGNKAYQAKLPSQVLSKTWTQYTMTLALPGPDSNVSLGFGWDAAEPAAGGTLKFMIDDIRWQ